MNTPIPEISSATSGIQWYKLIFYAVILPLVTFDFYQHRKAHGGTLGWLFLSTFCTMRLVGYILLKVAKDENLYFIGSIITNASTASLFISIAGIWHEAAHGHKRVRPFLFGWHMQVLFHLLIGGAIALLLVGAVNLFSNTITPAPSFAKPLAIVGVVFFILDLQVLCYMIFALWRTPNKTRSESRLLLAVALAMPMLLLLLLYSLVGFAVDNSSWSPINGGPLAAQICMQVIPESLLVFELAVFGLLTRNIAKESLARGHP